MNQSRKIIPAIRKVSTRLPTEHGKFKINLYDSLDNKEHVALVMGDVCKKKKVWVRVHSECMTGDVFGSMRCDCGEQLAKSMQMVGEKGEGIIIYMRQEGRGIGLAEKLAAYNLQDKGMDTVDANLELGHQNDMRDYSYAAAIIAELEADSICLITNNPNKIDALRSLGVVIDERIPLVPTINPENINYIRTKAQRMHHYFDLPEE